MTQDGDFYISPAFLDKMTVHIAKNYLTLPKIKVRACARTYITLTQHSFV